MAFDILSLSSSADVSFIASFLFIFAVSYALLVKAKVIETKGANVVIALVIGFFAASFSPLAQFLQSILPIAAVLLVILFFVEFARKLVGKDKKDAIPMAAALVVALALLGILWGRIAPNLPAGIDATSLLWIIGTIIVIMIFYTVYQHKAEYVGNP